MGKLKPAVLIGVILAGFVLAAPAFAQQGFSINLGDLNPLGSGCVDAGCIATKIIDILTGIATVLVSVMVLWGGFQILTAGGDPDKVRTGGKTILYSAIGFAVVLLAKGAVAIIKSIVGGS